LGEFKLFNLKVHEKLKKKLHSAVTLFSLIFRLAVYDLKKQYAGSVLGSFWALLQPVLFVSVIYFVVLNGFRINAVHEENFAPWLLLGMCVWIFISNMLKSGVEAFSRNAVLVKKRTIKLELIPVIVILSSIIQHLFVLSLVLIYMLFSGFSFGWYAIQVPFIMLMISVFIYFFILLLASIRLFVKDVSNVLVFFLQVVFWITPIFWSSDIIQDEYKAIIELNPFYYMVDSYRKAVLSNQFYFDNWFSILYMLSFFLVLMFVAITVFRKLRIHFADVV
jgi:ABC-type polysaccharide/polyol phosphate export permease